MTVLLEAAGRAPVSWPHGAWRILLQRIHMSRGLVPLLIAGALLLAPAPPAHAAAEVAQDPLRQFSDSVEALVKRVSPSVVQVLATGYGPLDAGGRGNTNVVIGRQRSLGSGVVIDPDGYIITNAHVVSGSQHVEVVLPGPASGASPIRSLVTDRGRTVEARVIGFDRDVDLAVLKVEVSGLSALPIANYDMLRQGELVLAFGNPEGLRNTVTMGVVSAVARQPDTDHPMVYIQTDAPINPGNSGGPLVNVKGELVGINAFILTESGGSQGLGFAIPSALVNVAWPQLRRYGHLHRGEIGIDVQTITTDLAHGLHLTRDWGLLIADLMPGGPAESAGVKVQDIIVSVDGRPMDSPVELAFELLTRRAGDRLKLAVLRGQEQVMLEVPVIEPPHVIDHLADLVNPDTSLIRQLGVLGVGIDSEIGQMLPQLRVSSGIIVAARADEPRASDVSLAVGDIIHTVNGTNVGTIEELRSALDSLKPHTPVVLQVERDGRLTFVGFELD
jgi:serine protease Do